MIFRTRRRWRSIMGVEPLRLSRGKRPVAVWLDLIGGAGVGGASTNRFEFDVER